MRVQAGTAADSGKKGPLSSLKPYDTVRGSMDRPISRSSNVPKRQSTECLLHAP